MVHARVLVPLTDPNDRQEPELALVVSLEATVLHAPAIADADLPAIFRDAWWGLPLTR